MDRRRRELGPGDELIGVGIERIDYTKGIPERLRALDCLLETHPEHLGRLRFVQVAVPSRTHVPAYRQLSVEVDELVEEINWKWRIPDVGADHLHQDPSRAGRDDGPAPPGRFCVVSSLHDGMNLVAKEFVASRFDEDGVLVLSRFTGSARELTDALLINPFAVDELADAIHRALTMPEDERSRRMQRMREQVAGNNVYRWAGRILSGILKFDLPEN